MTSARWQNRRYLALLPITEGLTNYSRDKNTLWKYQNPLGPYTQKIEKLYYKGKRSSLVVLFNHMTPPPDHHSVTLRGFLWANDFTIVGKRTWGRHPASPDFLGSHFCLTSWGKLGESGGLDCQGSSRNKERGRAQATNSKTYLLTVATSWPASPESKDVLTGEGLSLLKWIWRRWKGRLFPQMIRLL